VTRATETITLTATPQSIAGRPYTHELMLARRDIVKVHRLYVPGKEHLPEDVEVLGIWVQYENQLRAPTTLAYLNQLLEVFDWATLWGVQVQLAAPGDLMIEVTKKVERSYLESELDRAYHAWRKKYPHGTPSSWAAYALHHVADGLVECEINQCEERVVLGTTCCEKHQEFVNSK
jgi:hypothetical protein